MDLPDPPPGEPLPFGDGQPQPPAPRKRRFWEKPLAIVGIAFGFFPYLVPGFFALRSYTRWREGRSARPLFAWIWGGFASVVVIAGTILIVAFQDDVIFADDFEGAKRYWSTDSDNLVTLDYVDGGYRFLINDPSQPQSSRNFSTDITVPGLSFEVDVTERVGPTTDEEAQGLWCLQSRNNGYLFAVGANGEVAIVKVGGSSSNDVLLDEMGATKARSLGTKQHLRIECRGGGKGDTTIVGYVDGTKVAEASDPEGYDSFAGVGFFVLTSEAGTDVLWDNVMTRSLSANDMEAGSSAEPAA